jgi:hypothetical protein
MTANGLDGYSADGSASEADRRNGDSISAILALTAVIVVQGGYFCCQEPPTKTEERSDMNKFDGRAINGR